MRTNCQKSLRELTSSSQRLARAWAPIASYLEDADAEAVVWMPAHTAQHQVGVVRLSNGQPLTEEDRTCNDEADRLAKLAVEEDSIPASTRKLLLAHASKVMDVAVWIGTATLAASQHEAWETQDGSAVKVILRDAQAAPRKARKARIQKPKSAAERLLEQPRMAALRRRRVLARDSSQPPQALATASAVMVSAVVVPDVGARPSGIHGVSMRRHRAHVRPWRAMAPTSPVAGCPAVPEGSLQNEQWTGQACDYLRNAKKNSCGKFPGGHPACCDEPPAVQDLMELERSGARVTWPCLPQACASTPAGPCQTDLQATHSCGSDGCGPTPKPRQEQDEELLQELRQLQKCGFHVSWPR